MKNTQNLSLTVGVLGLLSLAGCQENEPVVTPLPGSVVSMNAPERTNGQISVATGSKALASYGRRSSSGLTSGGQGTSGDITLNFAGTDVRAATDQILGDLMGVNYTIDPGVQGSVTLRVTHPVRRDQLLPVLKDLLAGVGATVVQDNGLYRVVPLAGAGGRAGGQGGGVEQGQIAIALKYTSAENLAKVLKPFEQNGGHIAASSGSNVIIVSGDPATRQSLADLVRSFDTDILSGMSYALLPSISGNAQELSHALQTALDAGKSGALSGQLQIVPMSRIDSVLVVAHTERQILDVQRLYRLVEARRYKTARVWNVYYLQNERANDVAYVLQQAFTPNHVTARPTTQNSSVGQMGNAMSQNGMSGGSSSGSSSSMGDSSSQQGLGSLSSGSSSSSGQSDGTTGNGGSQSSQQQDDGISNNPLLGGLGNQGSGESSRETVKIIPDLQNNSILVYGTPEETGDVIAMLHKIDIIPLQVRIDATVAEVTLNDNLKYGTQFFFKSGGVNGILSSATQSISTTLTSSQLSSSFPGFVLGGSSQGGAPFVINLLQGITKVQVLSSPELMVMDNQSASLMVGDLVPYLTGSTTGVLTSNSTITNSINYQPTGVILQITPHVSNGDLVTLDVSQQVSQVSSSTTTTGSGSINSPTFSERQVKSRVEIADGQTVGLAGMITDNRQTGNQGMPWVKDIPLLGALAGNQTNSRSRTELLVLITPHVIHSQTDASKLTQDMRELLPHAAMLQPEMAKLPMSGSSNPNHRVLRAVGLND